MDDLPEQVTLWRCAGPNCGKWSHAKRRPTHHKRLIRGIVVDDDDGPFAGWLADRADGRERADAREQAGYWELPTVEVHEAQSGTTVVYNHRGDPEPDDWWEPESVTVKCGPFVRYDAVLEAQWYNDQRAREHADYLSGECMNQDPEVRRAVAPGGDVTF